MFIRTLGSEAARFPLAATTLITKGYFPAGVTMFNVSPTLASIFDARAPDITTSPSFNSVRE